MKTPVDTVKGRIVDYDPRTEEVTIKARYTDWPILIKREYKECLVQMIDSRPLSDKQRRACYALIREIADFAGTGIEETKTLMKIKFLSEELNETADQIFSLSTAPMSLVCSFQKFLIDMILSWDIPTKFPLLDMVDDIDSYVYSCLLYKKCCICGGHADLHHTLPIGMGRDRKEIVHEGMEVMPLCRVHHGEFHQYGRAGFLNLYHINRGIKADKAICKVYGLKINEDEID